MPEIVTNDQPTASPQLAVPTQEEAIAIVNRWLHREVGLALNVSTASFNSVTFCWHLPIQLAYGSTGLLGVIGGVYLRCLSARGDRPLTGAPDAAELQRWAEDLAAAHGIEE